MSSNDIPPPDDAIRLAIENYNPSPNSPSPPLNSTPPPHPSDKCSKKSGGLPAF